MASRILPFGALVGELRGEARRVYRLRTQAEVDLALLGLGEWLVEQMGRAPEFAQDYRRRYQADVDMLLDIRAVLPAE